MSVKWEVTVSPRNVRSVNVENELEAVSPLDGYVATSTVLEAASRILISTEGPRTRAFSITGPYGAGKSSFAHFISSLLGRGETEAHKASVRELKSASPELAKELSRFRKTSGAGGAGTIRAVATADREPIATVVVRALDRGLQAFLAGRRGRRPAVAVEVEGYVAKAAAGKNPSARQALSAVQAALEIGPMLLVIDELGKALEFASTRSDEGDVFLLQQIAELFSASPVPTGTLIALQHMAFDDYAVGLPDEKRREWRKIQGRFEDIAFVGSRSTGAKLLGESLSVIGATKRDLDGYSAAIAKIEEVAGSTADAFEALGGSSSGMPLHPVATIALIDLARTLGQGERSLVSYLTSEHPSAFWAAFDRRVLSDGYVRASDLYDYFIQSAPLGAVMGDDAAILREVRARLASVEVESEFDLEVLKTVGVLNVVGDESFKASGSLIAIGCGDGTKASGQAVKESLARLGEAGLLTYREFADEYRVWRGSDIDVNAEINLRLRELNREANVRGSALGQIEETYRLRPRVARRHSQRTGVLRYFESRYVVDWGAESFELEHPDADGLVLVALTSGRPRSLPEHTIDKRPLVVISSDHLDEVLEASLRAAACFEAMTDLDQRLDSVARAELVLRLSHSQAELAQRVERAFEPGRRGVSVTADGVQQKVKSPRAFTELLSGLCDRHYSKSPRVHNEMLNRRSLTSQGAKTRRELIERICEKSTEPQLGISGNGPDRAMYDSFLAATGMHRVDGDGIGRLAPPSKGSGLEDVWGAIIKFFKSQVSDPRPISELYETLMAPPYGVKDGPIPVLVAVALSLMEDEVFVFENETFLPLVAPEHFERMVKTPARFAVKSSSGGAGSAEVYSALRESLNASESAPITRNATTMSIVRPLILDYVALPEYSKKTSNLSAQAAAVRSALAATSDPDQLLFRSLPNALEVSLDGKSSTVSDFVARLRRARGELASLYDGLLSRIEATLGQEFVARAAGSGLREELRTRSRHLVEHVIDRRLRAFLLAATNEDFEYEEWLEAIGTILAQKPPSAWIDEDYAVFEAGVIEVSRPFRRLEVMHFESQDVSSTGFEAKRITLTSQSGEETSSTLWLTREHRAKLESVASEAIKHANAVGGKGADEELLMLLAEMVLAERTDTNEDSSSEKVA